MDDNKYDISQIRKYLNGELDAHAMHKLEREAQDDPFLMEAIDGYAQSDMHQQANLDDLAELLAKRVAPAKERNILLWRVLPIAAALLLMIGIGYWALRPKPEVKQFANVLPMSKTFKQPMHDTAAKSEIAEAKPATRYKYVAPTESKTVAIVRVAPANSALAATSTGSNPVTYKTDTVEYRAEAYKVAGNTKVDELLKHMEGMEVGADGSLTHQGQPVTKARLNGKDFAGGSVAQAVRNLPADVVDKIQIVDDYGDQAARTGIKAGDPAKVLNITVDSNKHRGLIAANKLSVNNSQLNEVVVVGYGTQRKVSVTGSVSRITPTNPSADKAKISKDSIANSLSEKVAGLATTDNYNYRLNRTVSGKVTGKDDGLPLPGVNVKLKGTTISTQTDANGNFKIATPENGVLSLNYVGYLSKEVTVNKDPNVNVELEPGLRELSEVSIIKPETKKSNNPIIAEPAIGWKAFNEHLTRQSEVRDNKLTGEVKLSFNISNNGSIQDIKVISGKSEELNKRAINIIQDGSQWIRGYKINSIELTIKFHKAE